MPEAFLPAAPGLPEPMSRRQNPQIGLTDILTNRNTSALRKTGILKRRRQCGNKQARKNLVLCFRNTLHYSDAVQSLFASDIEHFGN